MRLKVSWSTDSRQPDLRTSAPTPVPPQDFEHAAARHIRMRELHVDARLILCGHGGDTLRPLRWESGTPVKTISALVAGTGFYKPQLVGTYLCREGTAVKLVREPSNTHDANAIAVCINQPLLGLLPRWTRVGHLKAPLAARLAPKMDAGLVLDATVASVWNPGDIEHPRISLSISER